MSIRMRGSLISAVVVLGLAVTAPTASADLIISLGNPGGAFDNVTFPDGEGLANDALTVEGFAGGVTGEVLTFTGTEDLHASGGQARVEDLGENGFSNILVDALDPTVFFSAFVTNVIVAEGDNTIRVTAWDQDNTPFVRIYEGENGENFFNVSILADSGEVIDRVLIETLAGLPPGGPLLDNIEDVRQVRVRLTGAPVEPDPSVVPEPTSMILLGSGLVGLAGARQRRRAKGTNPNT